ncbi:MAG: hypothetical protein U9O97_03200 [Elusimicrobiota bacterium]|nr:hypothetical protein [Elusimicrobiota bacterium]
MGYNNKKEIEEDFLKIEEKIKLDQTYDLLEELKRRYIRQKTVNVVGTLKFIKQDIYGIDCKTTMDEIKRLMEKLPVIEPIEIESLEALFKLSVLVREFKKDETPSRDQVVNKVKAILQQVDI